MKAMPFEEWKKKAKKLKNEYASLSELQADCEKLFDVYFVIVLVPPQMIAVEPHFVEVEYDEDIHPNRDYIYYIADEDFENLKKIDTEKLINELTSKLYKHVSVKDLIKDALQELTIVELRDIFERVIVKKGKVKAKEGCFELHIYGKRGAPATLRLR